MRPQIALALNAVTSGGRAGSLLSKNTTLLLLESRLTIAVSLDNVNPRVIIGSLALFRPEELANSVRFNRN
ncbi:hypothetical protein MTP99_011743 [Tenebrio molitor]|jgi:hypothetical protein|nr:hypothetical protein MTP99_011743 [Tenebrio molitor]